MTRRNTIGKSTLIAVTVSLAIVVLFPPATHALDRLRVTVGDTCLPLEGRGLLNTYLTNPMDDILAFSLHIVFDRNDVAQFLTRIDTIVETTYWFCLSYDGENCADSIQIDDPWTEPWNIEHVDTVEVHVIDVDTTGTLISGWDYVEARSVSSGDLGLDVLVTAICDTDEVPGYIPPLSPQGGGQLFRLPFSLIPNPLCELYGCNATAMIDTAVKRYFSFSTPAGESICWTQGTMTDTNYYMCESWQLPPGTGCYEWTKVDQWECPEGECDSVVFVTYSVPTLDPQCVSLFDGQICGLPTCCWGRVGDANNLDGDEPTIGDISVLIDVLFISADWDAIVCLAEADVNQSGGDSPTPDDITIGDITLLIDYLFITGQSLGLPDCL